MNSAILLEVTAPQMVLVELTLTLALTLDRASDLSPPGILLYRIMRQFWYLLEEFLETPLKAGVDNFETGG